MHSNSIVCANLDALCKPSALSIIRKWRAQQHQDDERIELQERIINVEEHFRAM
jgi:hypothetical protein